MYDALPSNIKSAIVNKSMRQTVCDLNFADRSAYTMYRKMVTDNSSAGERKFTRKVYLLDIWDVGHYYDVNKVHFANKIHNSNLSSKMWLSSADRDLPGDATTLNTSNNETWTADVTGTALCVPAFTLTLTWDMIKD